MYASLPLHTEDWACCMKSRESSHKFEAQPTTPVKRWLKKSLEPGYAHKAYKKKVGVPPSYERHIHAAIKGMANETITEFINQLTAERGNVDPRDTHRL